MSERSGGFRSPRLDAKSTMSDAVHHVSPEWSHRSAKVQQSSWCSMGRWYRLQLRMVNLRLLKIGSARASSLDLNSCGTRRVLAGSRRAWRRYGRSRGTLRRVSLGGFLVRMMPLRRVLSFVGKIQWSSGVFQSPSEASRYLKSHRV